MKISAILILSAAALLAPLAQGAIIYDNTETFTGLFNNSKLETGDELILSGTARVITSFAFEYYGEFNPTGDETARVRFYKMDGSPGENPFATPGTLLYESAAFSIQSGYKTVTISDLDLWIPDDSFTFTVEFGGLTAQESIGLLFYDPPTVGNSDAYFWEELNGSWAAVSADGTGNNFAARVTAEQGLEISNVVNTQSGVAITVTGTVAGRTYTLEYKTSVTQTGWQRGPSVTAQGNTVTIVDPASLGANFRLYRVEEI